MKAPVQPKHEIERMSQNKLRLLAVTSFILAMGTALVTYIESSFLEELLGQDSFGFVFIAAYFLSILSLYQLTFVVNRFGKRTVAFLLLTVDFISLLILAFVVVPAVLIAAFVFFIVSSTLLWVMIDLFVETYSVDQATGTIRGRQLTIMNAGWVIMPALAGFLADAYGYHFMFLGSAFLLLPLFFIFGFGFKEVPEHQVKRPPHFLKTLSAIFRHRSLRNVFILAFLLQFFYAWMVIYTPMYLRDLGFEWTEIGQIFSVMLLPFVLVQYPAGVLADRYFGEKELMTIGLLFASLATLGIFFYSPETLGGWMLLLFLTRVGAALIEIMRDTYFFKQVDFADVHLIDFFRNTAPLAYMIAPIIATAILALYPLENLFLILGFIMLSGTFFSLRMRDTK